MGGGGELAAVVDDVDALGESEVAESEVAASQTREDLLAPLTWHGGYRV